MHNKLFHIVKFKYLKDLIKDNDVFLIPTVPHLIYKNPTFDIDNLYVSDKHFYKLDSFRTLGMSTSRDIHFCDNFNNGIIFELNRDKIKQNYPITPISWNFGVYNNNYKSELEEFIVFHKNNKTEIEIIFENYDNFELSINIDKLLRNIYKNKNLSSKDIIDNEIIKQKENLVFKKDESIKERFQNIPFKYISSHIFDIKLIINEQEIDLYEYLNENELSTKKNTEKYIKVLEDVKNKINPIKELENLSEHFLSLVMTSNKKYNLYIDNPYIENIEKGLSLKKYSNGYYLQKETLKCLEIKDNEELQKKLSFLMNNKYNYEDYHDEYNKIMKQYTNSNRLNFPYSSELKINENGKFYFENLEKIVKSLNDSGLKFLGVINNPSYKKLYLDNENNKNNKKLKIK